MMGVVRKAVGVLYFLAGLVAVSMLVYAGGSAEKSASAPRNVQLNFTYRITDAGSTAWTNWLVEAFNQQHQGQIHVTATGINNILYKSKIQLVLAGSGAPDVFYSWEGGYAKGMVDAGYAAKLDKYWQQYNWDNTLTSAAKSVATIDGHQYYLPYSMDASLVWYNTEIFRKYNLQIPKTWEEFTRDEAILRDHGIAPQMVANQQKWEAQFDWTGYFVNKYGVNAYEDLLDRKIPWTDPRVVATFAEMKKWKDEGDLAKGVNSVDFSGTAIDQWNAGQAAMWYQGSFILQLFLNKNHTALTSPVSFFPFPKIGDVPPTIEIFAENTYMMNAHSDHKDAAAEFLNFIVSKDSQQKMLALAQPFPVNKEVSYEGVPDIVKRVAELISQYQGATFMHVDHALAPDVAIPFLNSLSSVLSGQMTPSQAAEATEHAASAAMGPAR